MLTADKPAELLGSGDGEPELDQHDAVPGQHPLELRCLPEELPAFVWLAEAHDALDARPVVPGPVKQDDLTCGRQVGDIALQIPLRLLALAGALERDDPGTAWIQVLGETLDRAALAGSVAALADDHQPSAGVLDVALQLEQLDLQPPLGPLIPLPAEKVAVRVVLAPGLGQLAVPLDQHRAVLALFDAVPELRSQVVEQFGSALVRTLGCDVLTSHDGCSLPPAPAITPPRGTVS